METKNKFNREFYELENDMFQQIVVSSELNRSYEITPELNKQIKTACERRIETAWEYTQKRIERINQNYRLYLEKTASTSAVSETIFREIFSEVNDWIDDTYATLQGFESSIVIKDSRGETDKEFSREYQTTQKDLRVKSVLKKIWNILEKAGKREEFESQSEYVFTKREVISRVIKYLIDDSGILAQSREFAGRDNLEFFLYQGIISGLFAVVNRFEPENQTEMMIDDDGVGLVMCKRGKFKFCPVDTRSLVFNKNQVMDWFAEVKRIPFSDLLASATDESGNQNPDSPYDLNRLKELASYIKEKKVYPSVKDIKDDGFFADSFSDEQSIEQMMFLDSMVKVYEFHYVPIVFPGDKMATRSFITAISMTDEVENNAQAPSLFIIGARKTPFIYGLPIHVSRFSESLNDNDPQGVGLPEILEELSDRLNKVTTNTLDLVALSLYGITFADKDKIVNWNALENLSAKQIVQVKNMNNQAVSNAILNWVPNPNSINYGQNMIDRLTQKIKRVSRSGLAGDSIKPTSVSATEFQSVSSELKKQTNRSVVKIVKMLENWVYDMYQYSALYRTDEISILSKGSRYFNDLDSAESQISGAQMSDTYEIEKRLNLTTADWFVNGIGFEIKSIENKMNEAIEKQQAMEALQIAMQFAKGPDGQPMVFENENGEKVMINLSAVVEKVFKSLGLDDVYKPFEMPNISPLMPGQMPGQVPEQPMNQPGQMPSQPGVSPSQGVMTPGMEQQLLGGNL